jgi:hypothetical protein
VSAAEHLWTSAAAAPAGGGGSGARFAWLALGLGR